MDLGDYKVIVVATVGVLVSYIESSPLDSLRYIAVLLTIGYTLHRWYLLIKERGFNSYVKKLITILKGKDKNGIPNFMWAIVYLFLIGLVITLIANW